MIPADAIEDALDQADTREIERAFRALVGFPHTEEIGGFDTVERLVDLLGHVVKALRLDQSPVPIATREAIENRLSLPVNPRASYADAAVLVSAFREEWRALFVAHLSGGQA